MNYMEEARGAYHISGSKLNQIHLTLQTLSCLSSTDYIQQLSRNLTRQYHQLCIIRKKLSESIFIHEAMPDPDDETISTVLQDTAKINMLIYEIDELI